MQMPKEAASDISRFPAYPYHRPSPWFRSFALGKLVISLTYLREKPARPLNNCLFALRTEREMSRQYLAERLAISPTTVASIECCEYQPGIELALRISEFFDLPVEKIFFTL
jgi:putative transcriptional regulator